MINSLPAVMDLILISPQVIGNAYRGKDQVPKAPVIIGMVISSSNTNGVRTFQIRMRSKFWSKFMQYGILNDGKGVVAPAPKGQTE